jgi:hypothetical protein
MEHFLVIDAVTRPKPDGAGELIRMHIERSQRRLQTHRELPTSKGRCRAAVDQKRVNLRNETRATIDAVPLTARSCIGWPASLR